MPPRIGRRSKGPVLLDAIGRALLGISEIERGARAREAQERMAGHERFAKGMAAAEEGRAQRAEAKVAKWQSRYPDIGKPPEKVAKGEPPVPGFDLFASQVLTEKLNDSLLKSLSDEIKAKLSGGDYSKGDLLDEPLLQLLAQASGSRKISENDPRFEGLWRLGMVRGISSLTNSLQVPSKAQERAAQAAIEYMEKHMKGFGFAKPGQGQTMADPSVKPVPTPTDSLDMNQYGTTEPPRPPTSTERVDAILREIGLE